MEMMCAVRLDFNVIHGTGVITSLEASVLLADEEVEWDFKKKYITAFCTVPEFILNVD
jgi:hypothetical protein